MVAVLALLGGAEQRWAILQVPLLRYLEDRVPGLATVAKDAGGGDDGEALQQTVLDALTDAAEALQVLDVQQAYPDALGDTQPVGTLQGRQLQQELRLRRSVKSLRQTVVLMLATATRTHIECHMCCLLQVRHWQNDGDRYAVQPVTQAAACAAWQVAEDMAEAAQAVRSQMEAAMKVACAEGIIIAMPALPGPPPRRDASQQELARFEDGALQLASIAALSGVPQARVSFATGIVAFLLGAIESGSRCPANLG